MTTYGLFINTGERLAPTHAEVFDFALEQVRLAEALGYHDIWVTEHHFIPFGINSSALALAGFLLGRTERLRIGTAVTLAPQHHPLQLAEQAAILDQLSGGRFDFGIGRGGYRLDFQAFGVEEARWDEEIETTARICWDAWGKPTVTGPGGRFTFPPMELRPRPRTPGGPPLFLGTSTPATLALAAARGAPLLHYFATPAAARAKVEAAYAEHLPPGAAPPAHVHTAVLHIAEDETAGREQLRKALHASFVDGDHEAVPQASGRHKGPDGQPADRGVLAAGVAERAVVGPPDRIAEQIAAFRAATGAERLVFYMEAIGERQAALDSIARFAGEVVPRLASLTNEAA